VSICQLQRSRGNRRRFRLALDLGRQGATPRSGSRSALRAGVVNRPMDPRLHKLLGGDELASLRRRLRGISSGTIQAASRRCCASRG